MVRAEAENPKDYKVLSNTNKKLSIANVQYYLKEGDNSIKNEKPEVAVPLLVETIRIMSPNSQEGKDAYERLIQLGFVETKYKG